MFRISSERLPPTNPTHLTLPLNSAYLFPIKGVSGTAWQGRRAAVQWLKFEAPTLKPGTGLRRGSRKRSFDPVDQMKPQKATAVAGAQKCLRCRSGLLQEQTSTGCLFDPSAASPFHRLRVPPREGICVRGDGKCLMCHTGKRTCLAVLVPGAPLLCGRDDKGRAGQRRDETPAPSSAPHSLSVGSSSGERSGDRERSCRSRPVRPLDVMGPTDAMRRGKRWMERSVDWTSVLACASPLSRHPYSQSNQTRSARGA